MDRDNEFVLILVIIDGTVEHGIILTSNTSDQVSSAVFNRNASVFAQMISEPLLIGFDWCLLSLVEPPLVVHSHILYFSSSNGVVMLEDAQSIIELETRLINFFDILLSGILVNLHSCEDILLSIEEGRSVLYLLFEGWSRWEEAGPVLFTKHVWEEVICSYWPCDFFRLESVGESTWGRHFEADIDILDFITDFDN